MLHDDYTDHCDTTNSRCVVAKNDETEHQMNLAEARLSSEDSSYSLIQCSSEPHECIRLDGFRVRNTQIMWIARKPTKAQSLEQNSHVLYRTCFLGLSSCSEYFRTRQIFSNRDLIGRLAGDLRSMLHFDGVEGGELLGCLGAWLFGCKRM